MGEEERKVQLYICERCKTLLLKIDKKYVQYESGEMDSSGEYISQATEEPEFDYYLCPMCSGSDVEIGLMGAKNSEKVLKPIILPREVCKELYDFWNAIKGGYEDSTLDEAYKYEYGLPLSNKELKYILTEHLV